MNNIPNIGLTADPSSPLALKVPEAPPPEFPDLADVPDSFEREGGSFFVVEDDSTIIGMGGFKLRADGSAEALRVRVHPARRRIGVGRMVMARIEASATQAGASHLRLDTAVNQPEAVAFYDALGYGRTGTETRPEWTWTLVYYEKRLR